MFAPDIYAARRGQLYDAAEPEHGLVLLLGNEQCAMNYEANPYPFRQDSTFLYYLGVDIPGLAAVLDIDAGTTRLYGDEADLDEVVWMGDRPTIAEYGARSGVADVADWASLASTLESAIAAGRPVHFPPPYRPRHREQLAHLLGLRASRTSSYASAPLIRTIVGQRACKASEEVEQLEVALDTTGRMHRYAQKAAQPGICEREIAGRMAGLAEANGAGLSFRPTCSVQGHVLHNHRYENTLAEGDLLLIDAGASSPLHYAGDITRVVPVGGSFTARQRALYEAVLDAQTSAIERLAPGVPFREIHLQACRILTEHLVEVGLMRGRPADAVRAGAHALFFPHGLGHMLGLDTHDMENLGEDFVGYGPDQERDNQFGLDALRLARRLEPGFVVTVEPGCYFIPDLIAQWRQENRHSEFIDYDQVEDFVGIGGIRIEDDVLIEEDGARVLGPDIPKTVANVEALTGTTEGGR